MNVIAVLPYLVEHFEEPTKVCTEVAEYIAQVQPFIMKTTSKFSRDTLCNYFYKKKTNIGEPL